MKKLMVFIVLPLILCCIKSNGHILTNRKWRVSDPFGFLTVYFQFGVDTLFFSEDNINYNFVSKFKENGNNFSIVDLVDANCTLADSGGYTFLIKNDTLNFTLLVDPCNSRKTTMTYYYWISLTPLGLPDNNIYNNIRIYPNPAGNKFKVQSAKLKVGDSVLKLYDPTGRMFLKKQIPAGMDEF